MQYRKQVIGTLEKCYALSTVRVDGEEKLLAAAEKHSPCQMFDPDGRLIDTVWTEPGGVMTMVPVPGQEEAFLATHCFYSPNDSAGARLVYAGKTAEGWRIDTIAELPFVHRFDIIPRDGVNYVLACTLKSNHEYKNDWRSPGRLWAGVLGEDPAAALDLTILKDELGHNHGYTRYEKDGVISGVVSCDQGVFLVTPGAEWIIEPLTDQPASDAVLLDLDGDGEPELLTISPFHGDTVTVWHRENGTFQPVWTYPDKLPFLHAICSGTVYGRPTVFVGNREGDRLLLGIFYDAQAGRFACEEIDRGAGPANVMLFDRDGHPALLAANRETDEIAIYNIFPDRK